MNPDLTQWMVLCVAAFMGGAVNSVAGGGTLLTFPALAWVQSPAELIQYIARTF